VLISEAEERPEGPPCTLYQIYEMSDMPLSPPFDGYGSKDGAPSAKGASVASCSLTGQAHFSLPRPDNVGSSESSMGLKG